MDPARTQVLLVEDEEAHAELVRRAFSSRAALTSPFQVTAVGSLSEAREFLAWSTPHLIIADLILPDGKGTELLSPDVDGSAFPLVVMTGHGDEQAAVEAIKAGALDYVVKSMLTLAEMPRTAERVLREWKHILERRQAEARVRQLNEELEERVRQRTAALESANRELESFGYSVSHDLRAPLRLIERFSALLEDDFASILPEGGRGYIQRVRENARRMDQLIDDLLALSQLGSEPLNRQSVRTSELLQEVMRDLEVETSGRQVKIRIGELLPCHADRSLLRQVFMNLLSNALKFTRDRERAEIDIGSLSEGGEVIYSLTDNGVGFDMAQASRLFGMFQRLHHPDAFEGTGIGLANVQRIVHRHGGRVWAEAEPGRGATFSFALPEGGWE